MTLYDLRGANDFCRHRALHERGGDCLEIDDLLASGSELGLDESATGDLVLIEGAEDE